MSSASLDQFHNENMPDSMLQQKLATTPDQEKLIQRAVELGQELGLEFNEAEVLGSDYSGELDENELDAVAGGAGYWHEEEKSDGPLVMPNYEDPIDRIDKTNRITPDDRKCCCRRVERGSKKPLYRRR